MADQGPSFSTSLATLKSGQSTPRAEARRLYDAMTPKERLSLLDGDISWSSFMMGIIKGYGVHPHPFSSCPRLEVPGFQFADGPRGCSLGLESTIFPVAAARGGTWDPELEERVGEAVGAEVRAQGGDFYGGVCVNLTRHPGWGRAQESYGEDPMLLGTMGAALARGSRKHVITCVKHYALNSMEIKRFEVDVKCDADILRECYLPHFRRVIEEGGVESVMSAYNFVNGGQSGESMELLEQILRQEWKGEDVVVVSDFLFGLRDAAKSVKAGMDVELPARNLRYRKLEAQMKKGLVGWEEIERCCLRILALQLQYHHRMSQSDAPSKPSMTVVGGEAHRKLAKQVAVESMVLLENQSDFLPLRRENAKRIALIGSLANSQQTGDSGSSSVRNSNRVSALAGFSAQKDLTVSHNTGDNIQEAVTAAKAADVIILVVGNTGKEEGEYMALPSEEAAATLMPGLAGSFLARKAGKVVISLGKKFSTAVGGDRQSLGLRSKDAKLTKAIVEAAGEKTVLVYETGSIIMLPEEIRTSCAAVICAWYGGLEFGNALHDIVYGDSEPSGRLTNIVPFSEADLPAWNPYAQVVSYDRWWGYRKLQKDGRKPLYPFGFGLGYSIVKYDNESLKAPSKITSRTFNVTIDVLNDGDKPTKTVVQVYGGLIPEHRSEVDFHSVLLGFSKRTVLAGQRLKISVVCHADAIAHFDSASKDMQLKAGKYQLLVGRWEGDDFGATATVSCPEIVCW